MARIEPEKVPNYTTAQSRYDIVPRCPFRMIVCGPSGSGKSILLQQLILNVYRDAFSRVFIFSPSVHIDSTWLPIRDFIRKHLKVDLDKEECMFDHLDNGKLEEIIETQKRITQAQKNRGDKKLFGIAIYLDDVADDVSITRYNTLLWSLYVRGRHWGISVCTATQKFRALANIIRINITALCIFRLRSQLEIDALLEELSALYDKRTLLKMYTIATEAPHAFWYIDLSAKRREDMFYVNFLQKMVAHTQRERTASR